MRPFETKEEAYDWCLTEGNIIPQKEINTDRIKSNLKIASECLESAKDNVTKKRWNAAYKDHYDVLHLLVESLLCFDKTKSRSHQCLFTHLCVKHPQLELDWGFFEKIRTKRNGINYYGTPVTEKDWKEVALQFSLYINVIKKEVNRKLNT